MERMRFTLIELLVVISIMSILMSILLPSLSDARGAAKTSVCMSNTKQLALSYTIYTDDHKGRTLDRVFQSNEFWYARLQGYHRSMEIYQCTEVSHGDDGDHWGSNFQGWNPSGSLGGVGGSTFYGSYGLNGWTYSDNENTNAYYHFIDNANQPHRTPLLVDAAWVDTWPSFGNSNPTSMDGSDHSALGRIVLNRHVKKKTNMSFFDGSAKTIPVKNLLMYDWRKDANYRTIPVY